MVVFIISILVILTIILRVINDAQIRNVSFDAGYLIIIVVIIFQRLKGIHLDIEVLKIAGLLAILGVFVILVVRDFVKKS